MSYETLASAISILMRLATGVILLFFVIPLQKKEADVKNGLRTLRKQLLLSGVILLTVNTVITVVYFIRKNDLLH